ncbi:hypothetical protein D3C71_1542600 [compost metagenome]
MSACTYVGLCARRAACAMGYSPDGLIANREWVFNHALTVNRRMGGARQIRCKNGNANRAQPIMSACIDDGLCAQWRNARWVTCGMRPCTWAYRNALHPSYGARSASLHPHAKRNTQRRKTMRKLPKAARAAGRERTPQDPPPPKTRGENPQHAVLPGGREIATSTARCVGGLRCAGRRSARGNLRAVAVGNNEDDDGGRRGKSGAKAPDRNR